MPDPSIAAITVATAGLIAGGLWYASAWPESQIFGHTLIAGLDPREVALTFDDGPNPAATPQILEVLERQNIRATFFAIGSYARQHPALIRRIVSDGHLLGNHTMSHPRLSIQPEAVIRQELADCNAVLEDITGERIKFFRPPFGARRPLVLNIARELGLTPVLWNVSANDWDPIGPHRILTNLQSGITNNKKKGRGSNLLLHDGGHQAMGAPRTDTALAVGQLIKASLADSSARSTRFVTIDTWAAFAR